MKPCSHKTATLLTMVLVLGCSPDVATQNDLMSPSDGATTAGGKTKEKSFGRLYEELQEYRRSSMVSVSSDPRVHNDCEAFREIVARGEESLPHIIHEIENGDFYLNQAMKEITQLNIREIYPDEAEIGERAISRLWIRWWKSRLEATSPEAGRDTAMPNPKD
ncbi:MAG: hypothetical protein GY722_24055 [bacterium]|nr:hypothetical protein [bacterium]